MTTTTTPLTAWLGQVLDAREAAARAAQEYVEANDGAQIAECDPPLDEFFAANDPAAVLAMVEGLRAALDRIDLALETAPPSTAHHLHATLRHVAAIFRHEPGYDEAVGVVSANAQPKTCLVPVWDGPYRMICGMGTKGVCVKHGPHQPHPDDGLPCKPNSHDDFCHQHGVYMDPPVSL